MKKYSVPLCLLLVGLLIVLSGWGSYALLERDSKKLLAPVKTIVQAVEADDWTGVATKMDQVNQTWNKLNLYWPMLVHHAEMGQIDVSINKLKSYLKYQDEKLSLAELYNLIYLIEHIPQKEAFTLQNVF
ncbi:MAG: DUF4363 family protein [Clostridia bacterium]|jgi:hypothetical protein|nr:DUF4363 family protein [Clostridia bacterium]